MQEPPGCIPLKPHLLILKGVTVQLVQIPVRPLKPPLLQVGGVVTTQITQEMCQRFVEDQGVTIQSKEVQMDGKVTFVQMSV